MPSLLMSRRDLDFLLHEWLQVASLIECERYKHLDRAMFDAVLDLAEQVATRDFAPHNRRNDIEEPTFDGASVHLHEEIPKALKAFGDAGFVGAAMPLKVGGMQLPVTVAQAALSWFHAANVGSTAYHFVTIATANLLLANASSEQVETYVRPMLEGRYFGTMCLSEPQAGSSLADITTRAEPQPDGTYRLIGNKMWISGGDHEMGENIIHLVLARIPGAPAGTKGISLFLVPRILPSGHRNDVTLAGLNHKMGYRGMVNTLLNFGEQGGAVGWLVGKENDGLAATFHMMNEARIGVGLGATALGYSGFLHALEYARTRPQGRLDRDPSTPMVSIIEHPDVRRMLLASKSYVEGALALNLYCARLVDEQRTSSSPERARLLLDVLTPIAKAWPAQWCLLANDHAIQVHGGYGYSREYPVEQLYRDNRLNPIHDGTHGIQALDLLRRKVRMQDGAGLALLTSTMEATIERAGSHPFASLLQSAVDRIVSVTQILWGTDDPTLALANASVYLEAVGHVVIAWMWLEQLLTCEGNQGDFYDGKRAAADYFFTWELPRVGPQLDLLASLNRTTLDMRDAWF